jgi:cell division protein FtsN
MQANLALLGFESHVQRVTLDDDVFNRVRIGPIADLDAASARNASCARPATTRC